MFQYNYSYFSISSLYSQYCWILPFFQRFNINVFVYMCRCVIECIPDIRRNAEPIIHKMKTLSARKMRTWVRIYNLWFSRWFLPAINEHKTLWIFHCVRCASRFAAGFSFVSRLIPLQPLSYCCSTFPILSYPLVSLFSWRGSVPMLFSIALSFISPGTFTYICISTIEYASLTHSLSLLMN